MRKTEDIYEELAEWEDELNDALDEMSTLMLCVKATLVRRPMDEEEEEWVELEAEKIQERIDSAEFWIDELEKELAELARPVIDEYDELIELAEQAEKCANVELEQFGCIEFEPQFNWSAKSTPEDRGWSRAVLDIIAEEGVEDAEALFELY